MITVQNIASFLSVQTEAEGTIDAARAIDDTAFDSGSFGWCSDKNIVKLQSLQGGFVLISEAGKKTIDFETGANLLVVSNPRSAFASVLKEFFAPRKYYGKVHASAWIDPSVGYNSKSVLIGANVVIEEGCVIGDHVSIDHNTVIKSGTVIKDNVQIGSNCTIGGVGFGYEQDETGAYVVIPHIGNVLLEENVEIGNNVTIDRAVMGSTHIGNNVKVDNLVHIAHGVSVGRNSLIIANAMIAGSVSIGENVWVAPSASVIQKVSIADNAVVGLGSVVVRDVLEGSTVVGVPARPRPKK